MLEKINICFVSFLCAISISSFRSRKLRSLFNSIFIRNNVLASIIPESLAKTFFSVAASVFCNVVLEPPKVIHVIKGVTFFNMSIYALVIAAWYLLNVLENYTSSLPYSARLSS